MGALSHLTVEEVTNRLLGACLYYPPTMERVAAEMAADDILKPGQRAMFQAMVKATERGSEFDTETIQARLVEGGMDNEVAAREVMAAMTADGRPQAWPEYVAVIRSEASWWTTKQAGDRLRQAVINRDQELRSSALDMLQERSASGWAESMDSLYEEIVARLEGKKGAYLPTPFEGLNGALGGGLTPGEVTVVAGWTSHAKSVFSMQVGDHLAEQGGSVTYLTNEMRRDEVALRVMAGHGGVGFPMLRAGGVTHEQWKRVLKSMPKMAMKIVAAAARTCEEVCAFIANRKPDLAILDLFNRLPRTGGGTAELDEQVNRICDTAARANSHVLLVSQLNRARLTAAKEPPHPTLGDLRDTGTLETHPANVVFSFLAPSEDVYSRHGFLEIAKARNGRVGATVDVAFDPMRMRLVPLV